MSLPDKNSFYVFLSSNVKKPEGEPNHPWDFEVPLVQPLNFKDHQEWQVAGTSVILPPLLQQPLHRHQSVFIYTNVTENVWVGDESTNLLMTVGIDDNSQLHPTIKEPDNPSYHPLRIGYVDKIFITLRTERGQYVSLHDEAVVSITLHFKRTRAVMGERYLVLPSNIKNSHVNDANSYTVELPGMLNYNPSEWEAGLMSVDFPQLKTPETGKFEGDQPVGLGKIDSVTRVVQTYHMSKLDKAQYITPQELIDEINEKVRWCMSISIADIEQGSYVSGQHNVLEFSRISHFGSTGKIYEQIAGSLTMTIPPGWYTIQEFIDTINSKMPRDEHATVKFSLVYVNNNPSLYVRLTVRSLEETGVLPSDFHYYRPNFDSDSAFLRLGFRKGSFILDTVAFQVNPTTKHVEKVVQAPSPIDLRKWINIKFELSNDKVSVTNTAIHNTTFGQFEYTPLLSPDIVKALNITGLFDQTHGKYLHINVNVNRTSDPTWTTHRPKELTWYSNEAIHWYKSNLETTELYVYSDIVEYSVVGNVKTPLMAIVPIDRNSNSNTKRYYHTFRNPMYMPLRLSSFRDINIYVRNRRSEEVLLPEGLTVLVIHIRPRQRESV